MKTLHLFASLALTTALAAQEPEVTLPHYVSHPVPSPAADAPYVSADKTVYVLANDLVGPYFEALDGRRPDEGMQRLEEIFHLS